MQQQAEMTAGHMKKHCCHFGNSQLRSEPAGSAYNTLPTTLKSIPDRASQGKTVSLNLWINLFLMVVYSAVITSITAHKSFWINLHRLQIYGKYLAFMSVICYLVMDYLQHRCPIKTCPFSFSVFSFYLHILKDLTWLNMRQQTWIKVVWKPVWPNPGAVLVIWRK